MTYTIDWHRANHRRIYRAKQTKRGNQTFCIHIGYIMFNTWVHLSCSITVHIHVTVVCTAINSVPLTGQYLFSPLTGWHRNGLCYSFYWLCSSCYSHIVIFNWTNNLLCIVNKGRNSVVIFCPCVRLGLSWVMERVYDVLREREREGRGRKSNIMIRKERKRGSENREGLASKLKRGKHIFFYICSFGLTILTFLSLLYYRNHIRNDFIYQR